MTKIIKFKMLMLLYNTIRTVPVDLEMRASEKTEFA
jgi:hypothetical protein